METLTLMPAPHQLIQRHLPGAERTGVVQSGAQSVSDGRVQAGRTVEFRLFDDQSVTRHFPVSGTPLAKSPDRAMTRDSCNVPSLQGVIRNLFPRPAQAKLVPGPSALRRGKTHSAWHKTSRAASGVSREHNTMQGSKLPLETWGCTPCVIILFRESSGKRAFGIACGTV